MAFSISGRQYAYAFIYFLCLKENTEPYVTQGDKKPLSQNKCVYHFKPLILAWREAEKLFTIPRAAVRQLSQ